MESNMKYIARMQFGIENVILRMYANEYKNLNS